MLNSNPSYFDVMEQLVQNGKCWTDNTFNLREMLISHKLVSRTELSYLDQNWSMYDRLLQSKTWQELSLLLASYSASQKFTTLDWLVLVAGFGEKKFNPKTLNNTDTIPTIVDIFSKDVIFKGIAESDLFDEAVKNTRILSFICQQTSALYPNYRVEYAKQLCVHIFKKFPQLANHSANKVRTKFGLLQRFNPQQ